MKLDGIHVGKKPLGDLQIYRRMMIKDLTEIGREGGDWVPVTQVADRLLAAVNNAMNLRV
jgi:hypothetical protein